MISTFSYFDKNFYVLRDDLLGEINGNKARKLYFLEQVKLPYKELISYGSTQSNALLAMSIYAKKHSLKLHFFCKRRCEIDGNLALALENKANIYYTDDKNPKQVAFDFFKNNKDSFFINEGVCDDFARFGFKKLADEIYDFYLNNNIDFDVFLPSGTGISAIYLEKYLHKLNPKIRVFTTACVANELYLQKQKEIFNKNSALNILKTQKKYHFAKLYKELFLLINDINLHSKIEFEYLYDSVGFLAILQNSSLLKKDIFYIHQGGNIGNITMRKRYLKNLHLL